MARYVNPTPQILNGNGQPLDGAKLYFYEPGTSTLKAVYADSAFTTIRANPAISDSEGRYGGVGEDPIFLDGIYRAVQNTATDVLIWDQDPIGDILAGAWQAWIPTVIYSIPDIVLGSDDEYYRSIVDANIGSDPISSPASWELLRLGRVWNTNVTYSLSQSAYGSDGLLYVSIIASNQGNDPVGDTTNWEPGALAAFAFWLTARTYNKEEIVRGSDDEYYRSIADANTGNDPISTPTSWEQLILGQLWNTNVTYAAGASVYGSDGALYTSRVASNTGNDPVGDTTNWMPGVAFATTTDSGVVQDATKAVMENETLTGSSGAILSSSPAVAKYAPSAIKAHCLFNGTGTPSMTSRYNIDNAIVDLGTGHWRIGITDNMNDALYPIIVNNGQVGTSHIGSSAAKTVSTAEIRIWDVSGTAVDSNNVSVVIMGTLG